MNNLTFAILYLIFCVLCITLQTHTDPVRTSETNNFHDVAETGCHCDRVQVGTNKLATFVIR